MDIDQEIQNLKKLIITAEGETLAYLVDRLQVLLRRQFTERQVREECNEDLEPLPAGRRHEPLEFIEKYRALKIVGINYNDLKDIYKLTRCKRFCYEVL